MIEMRWIVEERKQSMPVGRLVRGAPFWRT